jgi:hypothetical protein
MNLVAIDGPTPVSGEGTLWRALEGAAAYRLLLDLPNQATLETPGGDQVWAGRQLWPGEVAAPVEAAALLTVAQEPVEGHEEDFYNWMEQEHLPSLAAVKGVLAARRYVAIKGTPRYLATYHLTGANVLESEAWKAAGTSPWGERLLPHRRSRVRGLFVRA